MPRPSTPNATAASAQSRESAAAARPACLPHGRAREGVNFTIGARVLQSGIRHVRERKPDEPVYRPLRIYGLDPSASLADGAQAVLNVPYEPLEATPHGLRGVNLEIVDDAPIGVEDSLPVRLDHPFLLMRQGREPSPDDRAFRQQMAYAVCSTTYAAFHQALGREIAWGFGSGADEDSGTRLRIRPCVEHLQNAYYDPRHGELRFGSFEAASTVSGRNVPGGKISLVLSHDVVVHEMSHAMLDGLRSHFLHPSNLDVLAFHEGFADLIALFQRFTYKEIVGRAIRASRGRLTSSQLLTAIAVQFAQAMNATGALRSAVSGDERHYESTTEPHARGEILVAAVFSAFNRIYERRTAHLLRLATGGTGLLPEGEISELLAVQLTHRASRLASQFLAICIRAIDYCPPVDLTFGEFLRAVITADHDLVPHDEWNYREAWIEAFAERRIYPAGVPSLSEEALLWKTPLQEMPPEPELSFAELRFDGDPGRVAGAREMRRQADAFGRLAADPAYLAEFGLAASDEPQLNGDAVGLPVVESVRSLRRIGPSGQVVFDVVAEITQRRQVRTGNQGPGFDFFGGATVILGPRGQLRYVIRKSILDEVRLDAQRRFIAGEGKTFFGPGPGGTTIPEAKLLLHLHDITRPQLRSSAGTRALSRGLKGSVEAAAAERYLVRPGESRPWLPALKTCLQSCMGDCPNLGASEEYDPTTQQVIQRLQIESHAIVDGIIGPSTLTIVGRHLQSRGAIPPSMGTVPGWVAHLMQNDPTATHPRRLEGLDIDGVINMTEYSFGALTPNQRSGLTGLLRSLAADSELNDLRWGAYMLATVKHECAGTWQPIEEFGKGSGRAYGNPVNVPDETGQPVRNTYYGRGFVQLTWRENYLAMGMRLGIGRALEIHPESALDPGNAYRIMSEGMRNGVFTGRALDRYINEKGADYLNARRIINGMDRASLIEGYANRFESMLLACS